jgi:hypothetical protein
MPRPLAYLFCLAASAVAVQPALAQSSTTQIEARPTYGATVTFEEGVRVFRPLPGNRHVIVNPNRTPLILDVGEDRTVNQTVTNTDVRIRDGRRW